MQQIAQDRIEDARILLENNRWTAAYYVGGYAVECGLKACILAFVERAGAIFKDKKFSEKCWTHSLETLVTLADLRTPLEIQTSSNQSFAGYWGVVKDWKETSRYDQKTESEARDLYEAITDNPDGVLIWIQQHW